MKDEGNLMRSVRFECRSYFSFASFAFMLLNFVFEETGNAG